MIVEIRNISKSTYPGREMNWDITIAEPGKLKGSTAIYTPEDLKVADIYPTALKTGDKVMVDVDENFKIMNLLAIVRD